MKRLQSDIQDPTFKICVPGRIITRSSDIRDPTLKKRNREKTKVVSTISALDYQRFAASDAKAYLMAVDKNLGMNYIVLPK